MTNLRKAAEMALKALEHIDWEDQSLSQVEAVEALRQALAQPEPEPVGQMCLGCGSTMSYERLKEMYPQAISCCPEREMVNVYTAPPRKKWVGLTDEELEEYKWMGQDVIAVIKEIQATLKEKNT